MNSSTIYSRHCTVYPGEHTLLPEMEALLENLRIPREDSAIKPPVNLDEFKDCYKLEVAMPGVKRGDILIYLNNTILSIVVLHKDSEKPNIEKLQLHEFESERLERHILLPDDADTEFISAEFRQGILKLHIPKTNEPLRAASSQIVVY